MPSRLRAALVLVLTIGLLAYFLRGVDLGAVWAATRHADGRLLAVGVLRHDADLRAAGRSAGSICWRPSARRGFRRRSGRPSSGSPPASCSRPGRARCSGRTCWRGTRGCRRPRRLRRSFSSGCWTSSRSCCCSASSSLLGRSRRRCRATRRCTRGSRPAACWPPRRSVAGLAVFFALAGHPERLGRLALRIERVLPAKLARARRRLRRNLRAGPRRDAAARAAAGFAAAVVSALAVDRGGDLGDRRARFI